MRHCQGDWQRKRGFQVPEEDCAQQLYNRLLPGGLLGGAAEVPGSPKDPLQGPSSGSRRPHSVRAVGSGGLRYSGELPIHGDARRSCNLCTDAALHSPPLLHRPHDRHQLGLPQVPGQGLHVPGQVPARIGHARLHPWRIRLRTHAAAMPGHHPSGGEGPDCREHHAAGFHRLPLHVAAHGQRVHRACEGLAARRPGLEAAVLLLLWQRGRVRLLPCAVRAGGPPAEGQGKASGARPAGGVLGQRGRGQCRLEAVQVLLARAAPRDSEVPDRGGHLPRLPQHRASPHPLPLRLPLLRIPLPRPSAPRVVAAAVRGAAKLPRRQQDLPQT
mmetsp:Transcript_101646/g.282915  ORF Transcript_101646/g.282915 Transcript_101646/m.282915 type:complete len:329 (-) Transcript_101646:188-1174(-)